MPRAENADQYIEIHNYWKAELEKLRKLLLAFKLEECIKWGAPVYMHKGKNLLSIVAFKKHCALWFFQGGQLRENTTLLTNAQEGKTQAMRQIRFAKGEEINLEVLSKYIVETIKLAEKGKTIKKVNTPSNASSKLTALLESDKHFKTAFFNLTPGRQREYINYIAEAKRDETKLARLKKIIPLINEGKGLNDKYVNSTTKKDR